jgi:hypothetical protein
MANFLNSTQKKKTTPPARQNSIQINSSSTIATNNALAQQQIANLQLASQIEQAQLQAQLHQQNAAVQNTALNNLAAALNLSIQPQINQTTHNQAAATAALFQQNPYGRPYLPIFSFTSPWQYAAAAAALQPLPDRCIIQPAIQPVHVFQQPTVNVVVKPQTSVPVFSSHHHHSHKTSHKAQKNDEVKITLNHSSPSKQSINSFHKSTSAPLIGVTASSLHSSSSYQVKIKTEKPQRSNTNYENSSLPSEASYLQNHPSPQSLLKMTDDQQLFHLQQQANNFLLPNSTYFSKMYQNPKITSQQPIEAIKTQQSPINFYQKKHHSNDSKTKLRKEDQKQKIKIEKKEEIIEIDDNPEINENTILKTADLQNNDDCTIISCSSNSFSTKDQQQQNEQNIPETTILKPCSNIINVNTTSLSPSSSSSTIATNNAVPSVNDTTTTVTIPMLPSSDNMKTNTNLLKLSQKYLSPSSTISHFFNDEDVYDNDNSISSFSLSLKANRKMATTQLWRTCGEPLMKLISTNVKINELFCFIKLLKILFLAKSKTS